MRILYFDVDTLRADRLGVADYHRDTTPNIDELAREGVHLTNVYASDVPCLPSRTALITGTFGIRNGVVNHGGAAAELRVEGKARGDRSRYFLQSWAGMFYGAGYHTASLSSFPFRHSATWWNAGFTEAMNLMRGVGNERADQVLPGALDWLDRRGMQEDWFFHVHLWDPHTPYNTPDEYGNPFASEPIPAWHTEQVRQRNWSLAGPHAAQEPWGFSPDEWGPLPPRHPWNADSPESTKAIFDGYDVGVRYADDALGTLLNKLDDLGILDETAILVSSDHGEAFGELGVYADHQGADEATCHIPSVLRWPGVQPQVHPGLQYHLDVAATVLDLAELEVPQDWDGQVIELGGAGREALFLSQGAWSCQRGVRFDDKLYLRTWHDGYHPHWADEMLFDVVGDPHETNDLAASDTGTTRHAAALLDAWTAEQLARLDVDGDPMDVVRREGGPYYVRGRLETYLERLRATGRSDWAAVLEDRHADEL